MRYVYCPQCGAKLTERPVGDEGLVPFCEKCSRPWFDTFSSCVITAVANEFGEIALLRQDYLSAQYRVLVSGYMKPGESAEDAAAREVLEEIGLPLETLVFQKTYSFMRRDQLMIGFLGFCHKAPFRLSKEVDDCAWVPGDQALALMHPVGSASRDLVERYLAHGLSGGQSC